ncbi:SPOC like C-terminal domain-containing protein [Gigaspora rosea]|uniref:ATP-dependent DNA helicase II subunit 1 n=1 Tax=Gigaspora rosea TaxID=44941 RepID=A0A397UXR2_9GLOM|nr:SPOC like C-terminal domain-containing protein [Gigaspora rosea]
MSSTATLSSSSSVVNDSNASEFDVEEEIEEVEKQLANLNRDAVLFVIDCSPSMMNDEDSPFKSAIRCASTVMMNKIITSNDTDLMGVMLFGTEKSQNALEKKHIYVLQPIDLPDIHRIIELNDIASGQIDFCQEYGNTSEEVTLGDVFWACNDLFNSLSSKTIKIKRIFLITDQDNPHATNPVLRSTAITRAKDLFESNIEINLFSVNKSDEEFNFDTFYSKIIPKDDFGDNLHFNTTKDFNVLLNQIMNKESPRRSLFSLPLRLFEGEGLTIGIRGFSTIVERTKPPYKLVHMRAETTRLAETKTKWICADTVQELMAEDMKYYFSYGGEKIIFTKEELTKIRDFGEKGLTLIGFKPTSALKYHYNIGHPYFIYPDEEQYEGSRRTFAALHKKMIEKDKIAICAAKIRNGTTFTFVALKAQPEILDENGLQIQPPGMNMISLPFADDLRPLPHQAEITPAPDTMVDFIKPIITNLQMKGGYNPSQFPNPYLNRFFSVLQDMALNKDIEPETSDATLPKYGAISKRAGDYIKVFNAEADHQSQEIYQSQDSESVVSNRASSRGSKSLASSQGSQADMSTLYESGKVSKATVVQLREFLNNVGIKPAKKKDELVQQVETYFSSLA